MGNTMKNAVIVAHGLFNNVKGRIFMHIEI